MRSPWPDPAAATWAYPVVGALVGAGGGLVALAAHGMGLPPMVAAGWALAAATLLTGVLHEDGLADTADGFGGGRDAARKLEIMRDSRIGSYGAVALALSLILRGSALAELARSGWVLPAWMVAGALSRAAILVLLLVSRPARPDGLATALVGRHRPKLIGLFAAALLAATLPAWAALLAVASMIASTAVVGRLAHRQVGGYTGDVLGAVVVVTECAVLSVLAGALG